MEGRGSRMGQGGRANTRTSLYQRRLRHRRRGGRRTGGGIGVELAGQWSSKVIRAGRGFVWTIVIFLFTDVLVSSRVPCRTSRDDPFSATLTKVSAVGAR